MESGEDEEDWERRDVQRQAQKKAKLLPTRQVSSPFFSFASTAPVTCPAYLKTPAAPFSFDVNRGCTLSLPKTLTPMRRLHHFNPWAISVVLLTLALSALMDSIASLTTVQYTTSQAYQSSRNLKMRSKLRKPAMNSRRRSCFRL
jgi:hypothetical protein